MSLGPVDILQVCDGTSSWLKFPDGVRDTTNVIGEFKRGIALFGGGWGIYQQALAGNCSGQAIGEEQIGDKKLSASRCSCLSPRSNSISTRIRTLLVAARAINPKASRVTSKTNSIGAIITTSMAANLPSPPKRTGRAETFRFDHG